MVVAVLQDDDTRLHRLIIGLSGENIDKLLAGEGIRIDLAARGVTSPLSLDGFTLLFGETDRAIADAFAEAGGIKGDTDVRVDPSVGFTADDVRNASKES